MTTFVGLYRSLSDAVVEPVEMHFFCVAVLKVYETRTLTVWSNRKIFRCPDRSEVAEIPQAQFADLSLLTRRMTVVLCGCCTGRRIEF